jgi:hypothetical protein
MLRLAYDLLHEPSLPMTYDLSIGTGEPITPLSELSTAQKDASKMDTLLSAQNKTIFLKGRRRNCRVGPRVPCEFWQFCAIPWSYCRVRHD